MVLVYNMSIELVRRVVLLVFWFFKEIAKMKL